jgi:hypothetical protein
MSVVLQFETGISFDGSKRCFKLQITVESEASGGLKAERTHILREHFNPRDNAAIGREMGFKTPFISSLSAHSPYPANIFPQSV